MHKFLEKIGAHSFDHPWRVLGIWAAIAALVITGAILWAQPATSSISIPGTEANIGLERMKELFPSAGSGSARIVVVAPDGETLESYANTIQTLSSDIASVDGVKQAVSPYVNTAAMSDDQSTAYIQVQLVNDSGNISQTTIDDINNLIENARSSGLTVEAGGDIASGMPGQLIGAGELIGVVIALGVLLATFASLTAAGMPILMAGLAVGLSIAGLYGLSQVIQVNSTSPALAAMLGLAVGIDYSLFIINKYRVYLLDGAKYRDAASRAIRTAGSAVIFAAATVVIALAALSVVNIPFMTIMGLAGAATVAMAAMVSVTLLPVLFRFAGSKIMAIKIRSKVKEAQKHGFELHHDVKKKQIWYRWGAFISRHPIASLLVPLVTIGVIAWPVTNMKLGLPTDQYAATSTSERKAYDAISKAFGVGYNSPLIVVVENLEPVTDAEKAAAKAQLLEQYNQQVDAATAAATATYQQRIAAATSAEEIAAIQTEIAAAQQTAAAQQAAALAKVEANADAYANMVHLQEVANKIATESNIETVTAAGATDDGTAGILQIIPKSAPADQATIDLIASLRNKDNQSQWADSGVEFTVTGSAAMQIDVNAKLAVAVPVYLAVVVGLSLVLLVIAFRSILVPLKATLGFLLSVAAMFGALVAVFQWGWFGITDAPAPIVSFIPIIGTGILFGLAMDYEFFLVSNMHEEYERLGDAKQAVVNGFSMGSKVVTAAAIIMISVFAGFVTNENSSIQAIGFGLAVGVLVDAFLVRMIIVPAVMMLLGKSAWWLPKWLGKFVPKVSIEEE